MDNNFTKYVLQHGGVLKKLEIPVEMSEGLGLCNPSVFIDGDRIVANIRRVNYMLHISPSHRWNSAFGPTNYHHPDNDVNLRTENYVCELNDDLDVVEGSVRHVDYSKFNTEAKWSFVGEEDARVVRWDGKMFLTGCRRDTESTGKSRMELSEIDGNAVEVSRERIPAPFNDDAYCEKNWMPVVDEPYTYVKWCNPLQVVKYDPVSKKTEEVALNKYTIESSGELCDIRGSSQVISVCGYRIALVHEVKLWYNRYGEREARYYNRFIVWDECWNIVTLSERFLFMGFPIEFTTGLAYKDGMFIIPFSVLDNAAFVCKVKKDVIFKYLGLPCGGVEEHSGELLGTDKDLYDFVMDSTNPHLAYNVALKYFSERQWCGAHAFFMHAAELSAENKEMFRDVGYDAFYMAQKCLEFAGRRIEKMIRQYAQLIDWDSSRCEAYYELSRVNYGGTENRGDYYTALGYASVVRDKVSENMKLVKGFWDVLPVKNVVDRFLMQYYICCYRCGKDYVAVDGLKNLIENGSKDVSDYIKSLGLSL